MKTPTPAARRSNSCSAATGHHAAGYRIVKDEPLEIAALLEEALGKADVEAVIVNGGTGIAPRDGTYEVVSRFLDKKLDGFGEIFRYLSYLDIGSAAIMSRAAAGTRARQSLDFAAGLERRGDLGDGKADPAGNLPHGFAAPRKMKVRVKFFAILRERAGTAEVTQELSEGATVGDLWHGLQKTYPKLDVPGIRLLYAVNQNYVHLDEQLRDGDEVVFLPPVSGG